MALAWPQTYCKIPGSWYDAPANLLRICRNHYYKVGHAAVVLISIEENKCYYFDFGRYHSPHKKGRVRAEFTDPDLEIKTKPIISGERIINFKEILKELQTNPSCHGDGELHASYCSINFESAFKKARELNKKDYLLYGPFNPKANNCSRFVKQVILAGKPSKKIDMKLKLLKPLVPTPKTNVDVLHNKTKLPYMLKKQVFYPNEKKNKEFLKNTLPQPVKHKNIPKESKWLSGEGSGSWFYLQSEDSLMKVTRYSPDGIIEFKGLFVPKTYHLKTFEDVKIYYPAHHEKIVLLQGDKKLIFKNEFINN